MLGIENLKKVVVAAIHLANRIDQVTADGFQPLTDLVSLIPNLGEAVGVIRNGSDAWEEFQNLDDAERTDLQATVKAEFDIADDEVEALVEQAFDTIDSVALLIFKARAIKKK